MRIVVYLFVTVAVLLLSVESGLNLWGKYKNKSRDNDPYTSPIVAGSEQAKWNEKGLRSQIATTRPDEINWGSVNLRDGGYVYPNKRFIVISVVAQTLNEPAPYSSMRVSRQDRLPRPGATINGFPDRNCYGDSLANIVIYDRNDHSVVKLFENRTAGIRIDDEIFAPFNRSHLLVTIVESDTNNDGKLDCKDFQKLMVYEFETQEKMVVDLAGAEPVSRFQWIADDIVVFGIGLDENEDGLHDPLQENVEPVLFNLSTGEITKIIPPDLYIEMQALLDGRSE